MNYFLPLFFGFASVAATAQDTTRLSLLFAGDIMGHDSQVASAFDPDTKTYDYHSCFDFMRPYLESADIAIGNLELTLAGPPYKGYPQFSSPDALAVTLKQVGFDVLVTANNHSVDRGKNGIQRTINVLDSLGIPHTGTFVDEVSRLNDYPMVITRNGFTLALLNYTYGTNGIPVPRPGMVNLIDTTLIRADIQKAKQIDPDAIIAFLHWGNEYESLPAKTQTQLAEFCLAEGANLVIGSHPHVLQPMEWRKETDQLVVYSLGNFVSGQRKQYTDGGSMAYVELMKIRHRPDSVVTLIDSAGYFLHWVYRTADADKDYFIMPVSRVEEDPASFIKDGSSILAFQQFVNDSRQLYGEHNLNVSEIRSVPPDSVVLYRIHIDISQAYADTTGQSAEILLQDYDFFGTERVSEEQEGSVLAVGNFRDRSRAERLCAQLIEKGGQAKVVRYLNGSRIRE